MLLLRRGFSNVASKPDPLRIALFGTDEFSNFSLQALHNYQLQNPDRIKQLDLITRPPKRGGRGRKLLKETFATKLARDLNITTHFAETKEEIIALNTNNRYNLAIAVSYGSFIPGIFLNSIKYGGLNVHPSLLPQLRGPAPLHHAILQQLESTGVTIQTLHPTRFDRGTPVYQSNIIPILASDNLPSLYSKLGKLGADTLVASIDKNLFINPTPADRYNRVESYAPKLDNHEKVIDLERDGINNIILKYRVFGHVHCSQLIWARTTKAERKAKLKERRRMIFHGLADVTDTHAELMDELQLGEYKPILDDKFYLRVKDGIIAASGLLVEGFGVENPRSFLKYAAKRGFFNNTKENVLRFQLDTDVKI